MLQYKQFAFICVPVSCDQRDMEFNIYSIDGKFIGTNVSGMKKTEFSHELRDELEEFLYEELLLKEAKIKFLKEFGCPVDKASRLEKSALELVDIMNKKWNVRHDIMDRLLTGVE